MNAPTQKDNQNTQPPADFDFILKQNADTSGKKPLDKRVIIIAILFVLILLVFVAAAIMSSRRNVKKIDTNKQVTQSVTSEDEATIHTFLTAIDTNNPEDAHALFDSTNPITEQEFINDGVPYLQKFKLSECKMPVYQVVETSPSGEAQTTTTITCNLKDDNAAFGLAFSLVNRNGQPKIGFYKFTEPNDD